MPDKKDLGRKGTLFMKAMQYMTVAFLAALLSVLFIIKSAPQAGDIVGLLKVLADVIAVLFSAAVVGNIGEHASNSFGKQDVPPKQGDPQ